MLRITIQKGEFFNEKTSEIIFTNEQVLDLEHSLISISKWESKWCKAYLTNKPPKTPEETIDYVRCMTINKGVSEDAYKAIGAMEMKKINDYINSPMSATIIYDRGLPEGAAPSRQTITSETIYAWMIECNIPFECQKWHINRLLTLIRLLNSRQEKPKKLSAKEILRRNAALNAKRCKALGTSG